MAANDSNRRAHNFKDLTGRTFGRLTVISFSAFVDRSYPSRQRVHHISTWLCRCECGNETVVFSGNLIRGNTRSCGCLSRETSAARQTTHGMTNSPEYRVWSHIIGRCHNPSDAAYADYGGRGIAVCERWRASFESFYEDMGPRPSSMHSIERRNNSGHYSKENCRWATRREQMRNTRRNVLVTFDGRTQCVAAWAEETGIPSDTLRARLRLGWSAERALKEPVDHSRAPHSSAHPSL